MCSGELTRYLATRASSAPRFRYPAAEPAPALTVVPAREDGRVLDEFGTATRAWFQAAFAAPTAAQAGAWAAIGAGRHALVVAPTGSGKTLAAFLWSLDKLATEPAPTDPTRRCRVLYVSPLKALAVDVERNLRAPLTGIRQAAARLGLPPPDISVGMRTGDTPAGERRAFQTRPPDFLITTPESLFLRLTSASRESLRGIETVIVDEVHALCATKRGAHLALSLERLDALLPRPAPQGTRMPAEIMAESGAAGGAPPVVARAHHGSVSKEERKQTEELLKSGQLPAVVATSSLELGIDMGAVDLVVQVEAPPGVAAGLQRVGRAGHQVGAVSRGVLFPKYRGDLVQCALVAERMKAGAIESLRYLRNPLDVLAQQIVAIVSERPRTVDEVAALVRRSAPFAALPESALHAVLDMLAGRYPSDAFAELRPRLTWDRVTDTLTARAGAQRLAVTSGGTIPDRGLFGVFLVAGAGESGGRRA